MPTPYSFKQVNGDGVTTNFTFAFNYLSQSHIAVSVNGVSTAFSWVGTYTVQVSPAPASGAVVEIRRTTPIAAQQVTFVNGSVENQDDLNNGNLQMLYAEQELNDFKTNAIALASDGKYDAQSKIIKRVAEPTALTDAATKNYVDSSYAASPAGHNLGAHSDSVPRVAVAGDLLVANATPKYDGLAVGGKGAILVGEPTQSQKMAWLTAGANESFIEADSTQSKGVKWTDFATKLASKLVASLFGILTTKGDLLASTGATVQRKAVGNDGDVMSADSTQTDGLAWATPLLHGQCRLDFVSATSIKLSPFNGNKILVKTGAAWKLRTIPSAGISAANTSIFIDGVGGSNLAANTIYYVYVFDNAGTLTLTYSTSGGYSADTTTGVLVKVGDSTRTLVGLVRANASSQFIVSEVLSWFNRRSIVIGPTYMNADTSTASTTWSELNTTTRTNYITWANAAVASYLSATAYNTVGTATVGVGILYDYVVPPAIAQAGISTTANYPVPIGLSIAQVLSEGGHTNTVAVRANAGNAAIRGGTTDATDYTVLRLYVVVQG